MERLLVTTQPEVKLLGRRNAFNVRKVLWLLDELGLAFEQEDWGRDFRATADPAFLALNPLGTVPVLLDGDAVVRESHVILRYLASRQGAEALYPTALLARARVEQWMDWVAYEMTQPMRGAYLGGALGLQPWNNEWFVAQGRAEWGAKMAVLDAELTRGGPWLAGAAFTLADIPAGFVVHRWYAMAGVTRTALPSLEAYYARLSERPAYRRHIRNGLV
jgi:glutathione S-transferase